MIRQEAGETIVEYAIVTVLCMSALLVLIKAAAPDSFSNWIEKTKRVFFVEGRLQNARSLVIETQER